MSPTELSGIGLNIPNWLVLVILLWSLPWKGLSMWKAAQLSHKRWFIVLLVTNTFGILDVIYIRFVARKYTVETIDKTEK